MTIQERIQRLRDRRPVVDHVFRMIEHVTRVQGTLLAGGVTYFGFLSFFPILALAFAVAGWISNIYPDADDTVVTAIEGVLPGIISNDPGDGQISLQQLTDAAGAVGLVALVGLLYTGLGWISAMRQTVGTIFQLSIARQPSFVVGKLFDLVTLVAIGVVMSVSVSITSLVGGFTDAILDLVQTPGVVAQVVVYVLGAVLGLAASTLLFFVIFALLSRGTHVPARARLRGALLAGIGFEALKFLVVYVLGSVGGTAFAPLALAVTLLVWINYCSQLTVFGAAWAYTERGVAVLDPVPGTEPTSLTSAPSSTIRIESPAAQGVRLAAMVRPVAVFGGIIAALWAWLRHEKQRERLLR